MSGNQQQQGGQKKSLGSYYEVVDFNNDPIVFLFRSHIMAGLNAFQNDMTGNPEAAMKKYLFMLRMGEALLGKKFGFDFYQFRKQLENQDISEGERLHKEMEKIAELLENRVRKVEIVLHFAKSDVIDFAKELMEEDREADEIDEELLKSEEEEVVLSEEEVLDTLDENEDVETEIG